MFWSFADCVPVVLKVAFLDFLFMKSGFVLTVTFVLRPYLYNSSPHNPISKSVLWSHDLPDTAKGLLSQSEMTCLLRIMHFFAQLELKIICVTSSQGLWRLSFRNMLSDKERCVTSPIMQTLLFVFNYPLMGNNNCSFPYALFWCKVEAFHHMYISSFLKSFIFFLACSQFWYPQGKLHTLPLLI